jgi:hypothetical protein
MTFRTFRRAAAIARRLDNVSPAFAGSTLQLKLGFAQAS